MMLSLSISLSLSLSLFLFPALFLPLARDCARSRKQEATLRMAARGIINIRVERARKSPMTRGCSGGRASGRTAQEFVRALVKCPTIRLGREACRIPAISLSVARVMAKVPLPGKSRVRQLRFSAESGHVAVAAAYAKRPAHIIEDRIIRGIGRSFRSTDILTGAPLARILVPSANASPLAFSRPSVTCIRVSDNR